VKRAQTEHHLEPLRPTPQPLGSCGRRELLVVLALTAIGGLLRLWSFGRLGLSHFDEGIYAASGLWIFSRHGILDLDPSTIAYAPPGFPFLVGLSYFVLGAGDLPAILVSIVAGTLTIPAIAWLAHRTFGGGAGGVAAAFAALSGAHIAFSRMALTDVSFLLAWVLALIQAQRFLERPGAVRAFLLGVAVGAAQLFKYNGWLAGASVVLSAAAWPAFHPREWRSRQTAATLAWGLVAALVAALVYWPWFAFVQSNGGYGALLAHQRGYLGGLSTWPGYLAVQLAQARALSGGAVWLAAAGLAAAAAILIIGFDKADRGRTSEGIVLVTLVVASLRATPDLAWWVPLFWLPIVLLARIIGLSKSVVLLYTGWLTLTLLTPFYHPYARLWLPLHAFECVFLGGVIGVLHSRIEAGTWTVHERRTTQPVRRTRYLVWFAYNLIGVAFAFHWLHSFHPKNGEQPGFPPQNNALPGLLVPADSLKTAAASLSKDLPSRVKTLRVLARPPMTFYLSRSARFEIERQSGLSELLRPTDAATWALLDSAIIPQDKALEAELERSSSGWVLERVFPTSPSIPVLLDIDPSVASSDNAGAQVELRLLRPKRAGDPK
jgi:dolichyl-phosphate-mannose-protein mannosyltransferase